MATERVNTLTIEQLASETGMTVRNIRSHQARGLLAPPEVRLRVGYYGPDHVARLRLIRDLQQEGFNLNGIKRLLDESDGTEERLQRFKRALTTTPFDERPTTLSAAELGGRFRVGAQEAAAVLGTAERLGVLVPDSDGGYDVPSPALLAVAEEVVTRGISVTGALAVFEELEGHCDAVARAFVTLFVHDVWRPFQQADMPPERWAEIDESIERLRPLASDALMAIFQQRMRTQIESAFGELTQRPYAESGSVPRSVSLPDPDTLRAENAERWDRASKGWGKRADEIRQFGMPVSAWMIEHAALGPGQRVLELAAGPGDTGFLAAELIKPGGTLVCSDASEGMLGVARARAAVQGIDNVEFAKLELEWIDLPAASVDTIVCRWGIMLTVDPSAAVREMRRVLKPGGMVAVAVWDEAVKNPWATIPGRAMIKLGHTQPPDPNAPGMFALAPAERLQSLLEDAGFIEVTVESVEVYRPAEDVDEFIAESLDCSGMFAGEFRALSQEDQEAVRAEIAELAAPHIHEDGTIRFSGASLVAAASA